MLAAVSLMATDGDKARPSSMTLMGPIDTGATDQTQSLRPRAR
jgi:poly-beta-hydroxyalkanoate depolymerase